MIILMNLSRRHFFASIILHASVLIFCMLAARIVPSRAPLVFNTPYYNRPIVDAAIVTSLYPKKSHSAFLPEQPLIHAPKKKVFHFKSKGPKYVSNTMQPRAHSKTHHAKKRVKSVTIKKHKKTDRIKVKPSSHRAAKRKKDLLRQKEKRLLEQSLQQQIMNEQQTLAAAHDAHVNQVINVYKARIVSAISHRWWVPTQIDAGVSCRLLIDVGPGGVVLNARILVSSGNPGLDHSVLSAVHKASPLPVPDDPNLFDKFRRLRLTVHPEGVL